MVARSRSRVFLRTSGTSNYQNQVKYNTSTYQAVCGYEEVDDWTDDGDCRPFRVEKLTSEGGVIQRRPASAFSGWAHQKICSWMITPSAEHLIISGVPGDFTVANAAMERTNPSRPYVDLPTSVFDIDGRLRDIRDEGTRMRDYARRTGSRWIGYNFGIKPLVDDIVKSLYMSTQITKRIDELNRLYGSTGLRRTVRIGEYEATSVDHIYLNSANGILVHKDVTTHTRVIRKCHIRWAPSTPVGLRPRPRILNAWAKRAVMGLTIDWYTVWELLPWSWLIDWYKDCGAYLRATRNIIPARVTGVYPMKHTVTERTFNGHTASSTSTSITSGKLSLETKVRTVSAVNPSAADFEFLNGSQIGILAALGASRLR